MQKFYRFWKKDFINKLIILVVLLITAVVAVDLFLVMRPTTSGKSLLEDLFPTPTLEPKVIMTHIAETAVYQAAMATASVPPTMTTMPFTPAPKNATFTPTQAAPTYTATLLAAARSATPAEAVARTPTPMPTISSALGSACIPDTPAQKGKVIDVIDGNSVKVLIDGLVYTVRYLGIELPEDQNYSGAASAVNGKLVFGKEVSLIADDPDKDQLGRLLRYVKVNDTFVNLELIQQGLATAVISETPHSCSEVFKNAEQSARDARKGIWEIAPNP